MAAQPALAENSLPRTDTEAPPNPEPRLRRNVSLEQWGVGLADDALTDLALTAPLTWGYVCSPFKSGRW